MTKPLAEYQTILQARKSEPPKPRPTIEEAGDLEAVGGGPIRRVVFEDKNPELKEHVEVQREFKPRSDFDIKDIHFEIDHMEKLRGERISGQTEPPAATRPVTRTHTTRTERTTSSGSTQDVDRVLADMRRRPVSAPSSGPGTRKITTTTRVKRVRNGEIIEDRDETKTQTLDLQTGKELKPDAEPKETSPCAAMTLVGQPCPNHARSGSQYCSSHKGYRPSAQTE